MQIKERRFKFSSAQIFVSVCIYIYIHMYIYDHISIFAHTCVFLCFLSDSYDVYFFENAFDTVEHGPLFKTLRELGVQDSYVSLLIKLYEDQVATVAAGTESRTFSLNRGVKQGDPISSLLFIAVMEAIFRKLKARWGKLNERQSGDYYGIVVDDPSAPLTNLRFADDVLLLARNKSDVGRMIRDLSSFASEYGLKIHMGKTAVMTNVVSNRPAAIKC